MDIGPGNADWADGAHGFVHLSPQGVVGRGVSMLKGRRADERGLGNGSNWRRVELCSAKEDEERVLCV